MGTGISSSELSLRLEYCCDCGWGFDSLRLSMGRDGGRRKACLADVLLPIDVKWLPAPIGVGEMDDMSFICYVYRPCCGCGRECAGSVLGGPNFSSCWRSLEPCLSFPATDCLALALRLVCRLFKSSPKRPSKKIPNKHRCMWAIANLRAKIAHGTKSNEW